MNDIDERNIKLNEFMPEKIAFCFLTYDNIVRYDIWNKFFKDVDEQKYTVFIHPKNININTEKYIFKINIIKNRVITKSKSDITIVDATLRLLIEAHNSNNITHFIFLSQSCIPLYNFNILYNIITKFPLSVISSISNNKTERYIQLSSYIKNYFHMNNFVKQQPNMILIRSDVKLLIEHNLTSYFKNIECPDEHYFINILVNIFKKDIIKRQINFCNNDFRKTQALDFHFVDKIFIDKIRSYGFLFMRKVNNKSIINLEYLL